MADEKGGAAEKKWRFDGASVICPCSESWPSGIVERFDGRGGENVIFHCHFCGMQWLTSNPLPASKEDR